MGDRLRVVLDTNVLVAAVCSPGSANRRIVEACLGGEPTAVLSPALRAEHEFILARAARGRSYLEQIRWLLDAAEAVQPAQTHRVVPEDPDDDKLVAVALAARVILLTSDADLLAIAGHHGLKVVRPSELRTDGEQSVSEGEPRPLSS